VFAPTDAAFDALPEGTVASLLEAANRDQLVDILTYHVTGGALDAAAVTERSLIEMLNGVRAKVEVTEEGAFIGGAKISMTDVQTRNGIIHVIDAVILPPGNIAEVAEANGSFGTLLAAVEAAGLAGAVTGDEPVTVFAPTDAAFAALPEGTVDMLLQPENQQMLADILAYHVVPGAQPAAEVLDVGMFETANGFNVFARAVGDGAVINEANLVITDIPARNGIIHVIDAVILPPAHLVDVAADAGMFTTLIAAVEAAGLVDAVTAPEANLAVFAPTDDAFAALPEGTLEALLADPEGLANILLFHAVGGAPGAAEVIGASFLVTAQGAGVPVTVSEDGVMIGDAHIVVTDIPAPNGVIHVIDAVILPPPDLITVAEQAGGFTTLLAAIEAAGLTEAIRSGEFTVFAPTDAAFAALPEGTVEMLLEDIPTLTRILQYHVVPGFQFSPDVVAAQSLPTLAEGLSLPIAVSDDGVTVGGAPVSAVDVFAGNGVIHVVDQVILPPMN
ncbi:MAG: fasciclin domain-containing protein, partial [Myxococcales bacterium]|nr:fasciclin domain-containing protein [Myxococcales bacterium]